MKQLFTIIIFTSVSFATVINVPSDYPTIQLALNYANSSDTVLVQPGTYTENIDWPETNGIKLISAGDYNNTIIDGSNSGIVIDLPNEYVIDTTTVITGFTIQNGYMDSENHDGGGIRAFEANPKIENVTFLNNEGYRAGGLFLVGGNEDTSTTILRDLNFIGNEAAYGSSIYFDSKRYIIMKNIYASNNVGGVFYFSNCGNNTTNFQFENVKIVNNSHYGLRLNNCQGLTIENIIIADNQATSFTGIELST